MIQQVVMEVETFKLVEEVTKASLHTKTQSCTDITCCLPLLVPVSLA